MDGDALCLALAAACCANDCTPMMRAPPSRVGGGSGRAAGWLPPNGYLASNGRSIEERRTSSCKNSRVQEQLPARRAARRTLFAAAL
ncbi:MAG: hypothetical protein EOO65_01755 [Methanosarcinales archaeon]|nr:MAG: hypothetical protein EOO65_01755 [Methanosarcinales archaeon]